MSFIGEIIKYRSLSIVGLEKNTGKTECLNFILNRLPSQCKVAVTSIGIDGESKDQVTGTAKPEIALREGMYFSTAEVFYRSRRLLSELVEITNERSSLGRIVTAKVLIGGKILLSGPSSAASLRRWVAGVNKLNVNLAIIDGALSRLSSASPAVSESLVLTTGAAYSVNMDRLVRKTKFIVELVGIEMAEESLREIFMDIEKGVWGLSRQGKLIDFKVASSLTIDKIQDSLTRDCKAVFVAGALTDRFLNMISDSREVKEIVLLVRDFTKIFVTEEAYRLFIKRGGRIKVLQKSRLIAVCVNPTSPRGIVLDSDMLCEKLHEAVKVPVYDIVKNKDKV
ncbi:MAG: hypothetical protein PHW85_03520 [Bacteroidales bacterium]|jgi:hypothetical protein|nr:hypothetical protein [Bacteroidales bacterium]